MERREGDEKIQFTDPVKSMWEGLTSDKLTAYVEHKADLYFEKRIS